MAVRLDVNTVQSLITPAGSPDDLVKAVFQKEYQASLIRLIELKKILEAESADLAQQTQFGSAVSILATMPSDIQRAVIGYPTTGLWIDVAWNLILRKAHQLFPDLHLRSHLQEFWRWVIAVAILHQRGNFEATTLTSQDGNIYLPGTGLFIEPVDRVAFRFVHLIIQGGQPMTLSDDTHRQQPIAFTLCQIPTAFNDIELNTTDQDMQLGGRTRLEFDDLRNGCDNLWKEVLTQAFQWIQAGNPLLASEMESGISVIGPLAAPDNTTHLSMTFQATPGLIALSWTTDVSVLVDALIHEYHHHKLYALMAVDPLLVGNSHEEIYYSPWRSDGRHLHGILHGTYVFQAVLRFWCRLLDANFPQLPEDRIRQRVYQLVKQVKIALRTLEQEAQLTSLGRALVAAIAVEVENIDLAAVLADEALRDEVENYLEQHYQQWRARYPRLLLGAPSPAFDEQTFAPSSKSQFLLEIMGLKQDTKLWALTDLRYPEDPIIIRMISLHMNGQFQLILDALAEVKLPTGDPVCDLIAAHAAYIQRQFNQAALFYNACIGARPTAPYFWQCFGFAIRHLRQFETADSILKNIGRLTRAPVDAWSLGADEPVAARLNDISALLGGDYDAVA